MQVDGRVLRASEQREKWLHYYVPLSSSTSQLSRSPCLSSLCIMLAAIAVQSFTPPTRMASVSTRTNGVSMQAGSRRELLSQVGGAAFALAGVAQSASAKAGQFGKQDVFGIGSAPLPNR
jgi:hypothetical protein